jgi:hypothetical protein
MSRGVVLWPDTDIGATVRRLWRELAAAGLPSMETHTHRLHQPHVSLVVADDLDHEAVSRALEAVPLAPIPCRIEVAGFFPGGVLLLPLVPNVPLIEEHHRVSTAVGELATGRWSHTEPGVWSPHMTCAYGIPPDQIATATAIALEHLPLNGYLTTGGIEDGTTGANWPSQRRKLR